MALGFIPPPPSLRSGFDGPFKFAKFAPAATLRPPPARSALILDGLCLHVLSSFQRTGSTVSGWPTCRVISRQGNLANLRRTLAGVNRFPRRPLEKHSGSLQLPSDDACPMGQCACPSAFPTDCLVARVERRTFGR
jgi:hypothetical protein